MSTNAHPQTQGQIRGNSVDALTVINETSKLSIAWQT